MTWDGEDYIDSHNEAVAFFTEALRRKVQGLVCEGFEAWEGEMTQRHYTLSVTLTIERKT